MGTWAHDGLIDTHQRVIKPIRFNHSKNYIQDSYSIDLSNLIHMGENRKSYTFFPINSILGMTKQTLILFLEASIGPFFGSFFSNAILHKPNQHVKSKVHFVNNYFIFVTPGIRVLSLPEPEKFSKT